MSQDPVTAGTGLAVPELCLGKPAAIRRRLPRIGQAFAARFRASGELPALALVAMPPETLLESARSMLKALRTLKPLAVGNGPACEEPTAASLGAARRAAGDPEEPRVAAYLRRGNLLVASPGVVFDVLQRHTPIGSGSILTDGVWAWTDTLAYYLETYHLALPDAFLAMLAAQDFVVPTLGIAELRLLRLVAPDR